MKNLIISILLALATTIIQAETITIAGHKIDEVYLVTPNKNSTTFVWDGDTNSPWYGLYHNKATKVYFFREDKRVKNRGWCMVVNSPDAPNPSLKSVLSGVDFDCKNYSMKQVFARIYEDYFCRGQSTELPGLIDKEYKVVEPGSLYDILADLVCTRPD